MKGAILEALKRCIVKVVGSQSRFREVTLERFNDLTI